MKKMIFILLLIVSYLKIKRFLEDVEDYESSQEKRCIKKCTLTHIVTTKMI